MNEMIERVAKAILEADGGHGWHLHAEFYRKAARFAIEAMREPTADMKSAWDRDFTPWLNEEIEAEYHPYQVMIDEALK